MEYDERMGIAYDTIFYGILCFNFEKIHDRNQVIRAVPDDYQYFYQLKETIPPPSPELYPFFYYDLIRPSALSEYFYHHFLFGQEDFFTFWERLLQNTDFFWQSFFGRYDPALTDSDFFPIRDSSVLVQKILALPFDRELILQLINAVVNPEITIQLLSDFLSVTHCAVQELFKRENKAIQSILKIFMTDHFLECMTLFPLFEYTPNNQKTRLSISFLNSLMVLQKGTAETGYKFLFGRRCNIFRDLQSNDCKVSPQVLCEALGNPVKAQILSLLNKNEFTVTQLSDQLFLARQTVNRHVLWLLDFMFIKVSKMTGTEIYYQINRHFFKAAKDILYHHIVALETGQEPVEISKESPAWLQYCLTHIYPPVN